MKSAKIIIRDEVKCKIEGLSVETRRKLNKKFEFSKPGAQYLPSVKFGRWNGKISYFQLGGTTYVNLLDQILPILVDDGYDLEIKDDRISYPQFQFEEVTENTFNDTLWPKGHRLEGEPINLMEHQVQIINGLLKNPASIHLAATSSGKTVVTAALSKYVEKYGRSLIIVPNKSLVVQTEADYINLGLDVGVYFGDRKEFGKTHTICTWQSINSVLKANKENPEDDRIENFITDVVCVIIDEVHQASAKVLQTLMTDTFAHVPLRWGLTGTQPKDEIDRMALFTCIGPVIGNVAAKDLQDKGILAKCHIKIRQLKDDAVFSNYQNELKFLLSNEKRLDKLASMIADISKSGNTLVLVDRIVAGEELVKRLPNAVFVSGAVSVKDRLVEYDEVATSTDKIIVATYKVAAVGISIPLLHNLVMIEPGKSFVRTIQSIGRVLRIAKDKDFATIWDITSNSKYSKKHLAARKKFYNEAEYPYDIEKVIY